MLERWPPVNGRRALDLACGTGRYTRLLIDSGARSVTALDFSAAMLRRVTDCPRIRANMMSLPFGSSVFDVVISGLAVGHAFSLLQWMSEVSRVLDTGGELLYSDFHPEAAHAGLTRTFKDGQGHTYTLSHNAYDVASQTGAAGSVGFRIEAVQELRAGMEVSEPFAGSEAFYRQWHGLPLVLIVRARKRAPCAD
ncbi:MAG TPA: class I SAM-dependent methyltransferase [Steroidobacteraceae bacterium]|nr:class I SAM-dependent methyltransferase [Steroidobacteraceae bacterium]